jgi:hypothetical protein
MLEDPVGPNVPAAQMVPKQLVLPAAVEYVPGAHNVHVAVKALIAPVGPNVPAGHALEKQLVAPVVETHVPGAQRVHEVPVEAFAPEGPKKPGAHAVPEAQVVAPVVTADQVPLGHGEHVASLLFILPAGPNVPAGQTEPMHDVAPRTFE